MTETERICTRCTKPALPNRARCARCLDYERQLWQKWRSADVATRTPKSCAFCGADLGIDYKSQGGRPKRFCNEACGSKHRLAQPAYQAQQEEQRQLSRARRDERRRLAAEKAEQLRVSASLKVSQRTCKVCGKQYEKPLFSPGKHCICSDACRRIARLAGVKRHNLVYGKKAADRARKRGLPYERCGPIAVCTRDGWRCQLCGVATPRRLRGTYHPHAPEVDHIIPLACADSPGHVWSNVQCLCRTCNIRKKDKPLGQLRMALSS